MKVRQLYLQVLISLSGKREGRGQGRGICRSLRRRVPRDSRRGWPRGCGAVVILMEVGGLEGGSRLISLLTQPKTETFKERYAFI